MKTESISNDHVGNSWSTQWSIDGVEEPATIRGIEGKELVLSASMLEKDVHSDTAATETTHVITRDDLKDGFTVEQDITVTEDKGRYQGNKAEFRVTWTFTPKTALHWPR